jgi:aspartate-semialdehyde dehydrogenase
MSKVDIAIVGATSIVAEALLEQMEEISFPMGKLFLLDDGLPEVNADDSESRRTTSEDSGLIDDDDENDEEVADINTAVTRLYANRPISLQEAKEFDYSNVQLVLFVGSADQAQREFKRVKAANCLIVDGSGAFRLNRDVPLIVAGANDEQLSKDVKVVASPSPLVVQLALALQPLAGFGLQRVDITALLAVSEQGKAGLDELAGQNIRLMNGLPVEAAQFPERIAYNVIPQVGSMVGDSGYSSVELGLVAELRQILALPELPVAATCIQVPVFYGHSASVTVKLSQSQKFDSLRQLFNDQTALELLDKPAKKKLSAPLPTPLYVAEQDPVVYLGRLRIDLADPSICHFSTVADNVRKGAAVNILHIALSLLKLYP